jgi:predicted transposase/invertase (TIGR01784 family)
MYPYTMERHHIHDSAYKYLFSNKRIFLQLLTSFVHHDFVEGLTVDNLVAVDKSFISEEFIKRESDLIYRLRRNGQDVYVYILLEFQSTVDKTIAARLLSYIMRLYETLLANSQAGKLPAVFPLVLYNGTDNWRVPENIADLIEHSIPDDYIPRFRFYTIIEKDIPDERCFFKSWMTFEKATLNLRTFRSASCGTQEARETARGLSKLTEF